MIALDAFVNVSFVKNEFFLGDRNIPKLAKSEQIVAFAALG